MLFFRCVCLLVCCLFGRELFVVSCVCIVVTFCCWWFDFVLDVFVDWQCCLFFFFKKKALCALSVCFVVTCCCWSFDLFFFDVFACWWFACLVVSYLLLFVCVCLLLRIVIGSLTCFVVF